MEISHLLARVIGPYLLIVGIGLLFRRQTYLELIDQFPDNKAMTVGFAAVSLLTGLLLLQFHNNWTPDWRLLITGFCWLVTLKGAIALLFPEALAGLSQTYRENHRLLVLNGAITMLFGLLLSYIGYFT